MAQGTGQGRRPGAAGADQDQAIGSTAAGLRGRLRLGGHAASSIVRTARALLRGPLAATGQAVCAGDILPAHAQVLAHGTKELPEHVTAAAEPTLVAAAARLDPSRRRRVVGDLVQAPTRQRRGGSGATPCPPGPVVGPTFAGMVAVDGLLEPEAGELVLAALEPLARPADAGDTRSGSQRTADAVTELARRQLEEGGQSCPPPVGSARSWPWWWSWTASTTPVGWVERPAGRDRWLPRPGSGWPAMGPSPGW
jgi:hypothetical protein